MLHFASHDRYDCSSHRPPLTKSTWLHTIFRYHAQAYDLLFFFFERLTLLALILLCGLRY